MSESDTSFQDFIDSKFLHWLDEYSLLYKDVGPNLKLVFCDKFCIKLYDKAGHGHSFTANVAPSYSEDMYHDDEITIHWLFSYFGLEQSYSFSKRTKKAYVDNIPVFIHDLQILIEHLIHIDETFWADLRRFVSSDLEGSTGKVVLN